MPRSATITTTDIRYAGGRVAAEVTGSVTRDFTTDEAGVIRKMVVTGGTNAGTYLPVWNGHGDLVALWRVNADGSLTLAASVTYGTWGTPTVTSHNGIGDLAFRYLYVGASDVQWDNELGLGLLYMHARHYSPVLGRFLQPDPIDAEANLYAYAENSPVSKVDPEGTFPCLIPIVGWSVCGAVVKLVVATMLSAPRVVSFLSLLGITSIKFGHQISLATQRLGHIISQHGQLVTNATLRTRDVWRTGLENSTRFFSNSQILPLIQETLRSPTTGRFVDGAMEYARKYPYAVGIDGHGNLQYWMRVIVVNGRVVTAYPTSRPFR